NFNIVGEEWVDDPAMISYWQRGKVNPDGNNSCLPSLMDFPMTMNLHRALRDEEAWGEGLIRLYQTLSKDYHYPEPDNLVIFPDNHDMSRILTQLNEDYDLFKMAISYILTMRGIPQIYYGTEILMANPGTDSHGVIRSDFPGGWSGDAVNAFSGDGLPARARATQEFLRTLLHWRRDAAVIHHGELIHYVPADGIYVYFRMLDGQTIMVILNKNREETRLELDRFRDQIDDNRFGHDVAGKVSYELNDHMMVPARTALILELTNR
ncbi:MAG: cyclomaltodextrinase C-terminal domain-containing protein, partial [Saprospiraceae bacterium]|nr:cyclomaltodextrinase C-terminal domain-containing protein [Saprospiraceae bacterium]